MLLRVPMENVSISCNGINKGNKKKDVKEYQRGFNWAGQRHLLKNVMTS